MEGIGKGHRVIAHEATGEVSGVEKKIPLLSFIMRTLCVRGGEILEKKIHPPAQKMSSSRLQRQHCGILPRGRVCPCRTAPRRCRSCWRSGRTRPRAWSAACGNVARPQGQA